MPTEIEKQYVSDLVDKYRQELNIENKDTLAERTKENYSHFEKLSPEDRKQKTLSLGSMVKHGYRGGEQYS